MLLCAGCDHTLLTVITPCALCSKSEIRYEGTLFAIDTKESTVTLQNGNCSLAVLLLV